MRSDQAMNIVLVGGSGFLGLYMVRAFTKLGHRCTVLTRNPAQRRNMQLAKGARLVQCDVHDRDALTQAFANADAVVSMAGILNESPLGGNDFERVHVDLVQSIVEACKASGVRRLLHVSALNAGKGESRYLETKGRAETLLRDEQELDITIFRPSVIFGPGDSFFNRFADLLRWTPVLPLACAGARMQPVYAGDVAAVAAAALGDAATFGHSYELGGPAVYTLQELVRFTARTLGLRRCVVPQPNAFSYAQGVFMGLLPGAPFSLDNFRSLQTDNVTEHNGLDHFHISPASIESVVPGYLGTSLHQRRLGNIRKRARRDD
jgi:NADH dehydrogenase